MYIFPLNDLLILRLRIETGIVSVSVFEILKRNEAKGKVVVLWRQQMPDILQHFVLTLQDAQGCTYLILTWNNITIPLKVSNKLWIS